MEWYYMALPQSTRNEMESFYNQMHVCANTFSLIFDITFQMSMNNMRMGMNNGMTNIGK